MEQKEELECSQSQEAMETATHCNVSKDTEK